MKSATVFLLLAVIHLARAYSNQVIIDCLQFSGNTGKYLVNTFFADTSRGWRTQPLRGTCIPGTLQVHDLQEPIGYAWIKGESASEAIIRVTSQQNGNNGLQHQEWSYKGASIFILTTTKNPANSASLIGAVQNLADPVICDGDDGPHGNGYCELHGPTSKDFRTTPPYHGTVYEINLPEPQHKSAFSELEYQSITQGGAIYGQYWDYRNSKWNKDDCYTFTAHFLDDHQFEVTCPVKDFTSKDEAKTKAVEVLTILGKIPKFARSWLKTLAINGGGTGSRAGANGHRKSMTMNLSPTLVQHSYQLFLHEGAHVGLLSFQGSAKWKQAQKLDPTFISTYAKGSPIYEDVSESLVPWMLVKNHPTAAQVATIRATIPNRLAALDDYICVKFPEFQCNPSLMTEQKFKGLPGGVSQTTYVTHAFLVKEENTMTNVALFQTKSRQDLVNNLADGIQLYGGYLPDRTIGLKFLNSVHHLDAVTINSSEEVSKVLAGKSMKSSFLSGDKGYTLKIKNLTDKPLVAYWIDYSGNPVLTNAMKIPAAST